MPRDQHPWGGELRLRAGMHRRDSAPLRRAAHRVWRLIPVLAVLSVASPMLAGCGKSDEAQRKPEQIMKDVSKDLASETSVRIAAKVQPPNSTDILTVDVTDTPSGGRGYVQRGAGAKIDVITRGDDIYFGTTRPLPGHHGKPKTEVWFRAPTNGLFDTLTSLLKLDRVAVMFAKPTDQLTKSLPGRIGTHKDAILLTDSVSKSELYVTNEAHPRPILLQFKGGDHPGAIYFYFTDQPGEAGGCRDNPSCESNKGPS